MIHAVLLNKAELLQLCSLIIWDESPMVKKWTFKALDRALKDIMHLKVTNSLDKPFGGKIVFLSGNFR